METEKNQLFEDLKGMGFTLEQIEPAYEKADQKTIECLVQCIEASQSTNMEEEKQPEQQQGLPISDKVNQAYVTQLIGMGYTKNASEKALFLTQNKSTEIAIDWLVQHMEEPDFNEQLFIVGQQETRVMSKEEALFKAKELQNQLREKKKKEEEAYERERIKKQYQEGKEFQKTQEQLKEAQRQFELKQMQIQKQKDEQDKQKMLQILENDKRERLGNKYKASSENSLSEKFEKSIKAILVAYAPGTFPLKAKTCYQTLAKLIENLMKNPNEQKFKQINLQNKVFHERVGDLLGGITSLENCGFYKADTFLKIDNVDVKLLESNLTILNNQLKLL